MDWKQLIAEIQARGLSQQQIATKCKCTQSTISDLASGTTGQPRYSLGEALRALHFETTTAQPDRRDADAKAS
jgi:transcriptional regulator with XRE-family HTH domain